MHESRFAFGHLRWIDPPDHQAPLLLEILKNRKLAHEALYGNEELCGTIFNDDGLPVMCAGIYRYDGFGLAWTLFNRDMKKEMVFCVRTVRRYIAKFKSLTDFPIYATVDASIPDAIRWNKLVGFRPCDEGDLWWV